MKIFRTAQVKQLDALTIAYEPITSIDLMERAAEGLYAWFAVNVPSTVPIMVICGTGNNGGDGLALARMLHVCGYNVRVCHVQSNGGSPDFETNLQRLERVELRSMPIATPNDFPTLNGPLLVVDALFGSGLSRSLTGIYKQLVEHINASGARVVAIDIPSGLFGEDNPTPNGNAVVRANVCLTLEQPKLSFFFAENFRFVGNWQVIPIGIDENAKLQTPSELHFTTLSDIKPMMHVRQRFAHKGTFGHLLVAAGSYGMLGAAQLCVEAALRSGVGLVTAHIPKCGFQIFQQNLPEALVRSDADHRHLSAIEPLTPFTAICVGPGIATADLTVEALRKLLINSTVPIVLDADALNIIAAAPQMWDLVPSHAVITPHPKEFDRLFGTHSNAHDRLRCAMAKAREHQIVIVLKGAYTQVVTPDSQVFFNSTGNVGMATGGSGDVLAGIIGGLLAQGYPPVEAAVIGVFLHGLAGDLAAELLGQDALKSSDIPNFVADAFLKVRGYR